MLGGVERSDGGRHSRLGLAPVGLATTGSGRRTMLFLLNCHFQFERPPKSVRCRAGARRVICHS